MSLTFDGIDLKALELFVGEFEALVNTHLYGD